MLWAWDVISGFSIASQSSIATSLDIGSAGCPFPGALELSRGAELAVEVEESGGA